MRVMNNLPKLRDAPDHIKQQSVRYDLNEEERKSTKTLVEQAKKSPNYEFKVRGPPWNMEGIKNKINSIRGRKHVSPRN